MGRYALHGAIASGGMATVHFGRLVSEAGFSRTVAIKRLHPQHAQDPEFTAMFLDEARVAARIQHPNVVPTLDVVALDAELLLVMEYVQGESLARLIRAHRERDAGAPPTIAASIVGGALHGLHAAHIATNEQGEPLGIVHRDVSPENILVGIDGVPRVLDFGVAKARGRLHTTREGQIKGKIAYMAPEQLRAQPVDPRTDVYGAAIVLWELLTGRRLFTGDNEGAIIVKILGGNITPPSQLVPDLPPALDDIVMRGLAQDPEDRFTSAWDMAVALEDATGIASPRQIGAWVEQLASAAISRRARQIQDIESVSRPIAFPLVPSSAPPSSTSPAEVSSSTAPAAGPSSASPAAPSSSAFPAVIPALPIPTHPSQGPQSTTAPSATAPSTTVPSGPPTPPPSWSATRVSAAPPPPQPQPQPSPSGPTAIPSSPAGPLRPALLVVVAAALGGLAATLTLTLGGAPQPASTTDLASASAAPRASSPSTAVDAETPAPALAASLASAPSAPTVAPAAPPPDPTAAALTAPTPAAAPSGTTAPTPHGATPRSTTGTTKPPRTSCNPPYTVDARGIRRIKPECM
ncbi:serine/threonine-protein kinase [Chondromyces crocatus]|uniref:Protein kinase n=1 Tax=Chondromyces crocatus TaxID=52 RepID=A0A0K1ESB5_CHOCO|nr:serine/threonine-protein kinase [Chondromyces crocatus]AKT43542.1 protein kinase [Chondromyces crocatus]